MSDDDVNLDEILSEELKNIQSRDDEPEETTTEVVEEETEVEARPKRERDEQGRFKAKDKDDAEEDVSEVLPEIGVEEEQPVQIKGAEEQVEEVTEEPIQEETNPSLERPPTTWRTEAKLKWKDIDPTIRDEIIKREADVGRGINQYRNDAEYGKQVMQSVQPYIATINSVGSTPKQAIETMLNTFYQLNTGDPVSKANVLLQAAQQYGADMTVFQQEVDPAQNQLQQQLHPLQQQINQLTNQLQQRDAQAQQFEDTQADTAVEAFRNATDENGIKYPHFDIVSNSMASYIEQEASIGQSLSLEDAYDRAIWADPIIRQQLLSEQATNGESLRQQEKKDLVDKAKKADKVNLQQKGSYNEKPSKPTGSLNDTLKDTMHDIQHRQ